MKKLDKYPKCWCGRKCVRSGDGWVHCEYPYRDHTVVARTDQQGLEALANAQRIPSA